MGLGDRLSHAFNAFLNKDPTYGYGERNQSSYVYSSGYRPDRVRLSRGNERSIATAVYNRIALDVAAMTIMHVILDDNGRYTQTVDSSLNNCLTLEANKDQTARAFIQDAVLSLLDEGVIAIVPIDTKIDPKKSGSLFDIETMRVGKIIRWYPDFVDVEVYNDRTGQKQTLHLPKKTTAIVENPLYAVINDPNSTLQRLIRKLALLDMTDEKNSSGKLDLIIQLPYVVKTEARKKQAEERRKEVEDQLVGSQYGIAYTDGTEKITQLNRAVENNLMSQIQYLTETFYSQLGITPSILDGTADDTTMLNYYNRTIEPIISAIVDEMKRKFLTKTARTQHHSIIYFRDPFRLVPVSQISEIADKFTRNEIMTSNEVRQIIGMKPSDDPNADILRNKNLNQSTEEAIPHEPGEEMYPEEEVPA